MKRSALETALKIPKGLVSTPPHLWLKRWRERDVIAASSRDEYLSRKAVYTDNQLLIGGLEIMQDWERPLMKRLAEIAAGTKGSVLEVGFGMGISATCLMQAGCSRYTIIEPHPGVLERIREWSKTQPAPVTVVQGFWEDTIESLGEFDGILFDTYPITESEVASNTLMREFVPHAARHLRPGGVFTFYGSWPEQLPAEDMELLEKHFSKVEIESVTGLKPPDDCQYYESDRMLVPICTK